METRDWGLGIREREIKKTAIGIGGIKEHSFSPRLYGLV
jgi:hypothetical protein